LFILFEIFNNNFNKKKKFKILENSKQKREMFKTFWLPVLIGKNNNRFKINYNNNKFYEFKIWVLIVSSAQIATNAQETCSVDSDCSGLSETPICLPTDSICVQCVIPTQCSADTPVCENNKCVAN